MIECVCSSCGCYGEERCRDTEIALLEADLRGIQIAYGELSQKYDQLKQEYESCFDDEDLEEDAPDWSL